MEDQEGDLEMVELTTDPAQANFQSSPQGTGNDEKIQRHSRKPISYAKYVSLRKSISPLNRYLVGFFACSLVLGSYAAYDCVGAASPYLKLAFGFSNSDLGLLYSAYSLPNLFSVILGGALIDRIGPIKAGYAYATTLFLGNVLLFFAPLIFEQPLWVMVLARVLHGAGSESLVIVQTTVLSRWFGDRELGFAFGWSIALTRLGSVAVFLSIPIVSAIDVQWAFFGAVCGAIFSFGAMIGIHLSSGRFTATLSASPTKSVSAEKPSSDFEEKLKEEGEPNKRKDQDTFSKKRSVSVEKISLLGSIRSFRGEFWSMAIIVGSAYGATLTFVAFGTSLLHEQYNYSESASGRLNSAVAFSAVFLAPLIGYAMDRWGYRLTSMTSSFVIMVPSFLFLGSGFLPPAIPLFGIAVGFSGLQATMWPCAPMVTTDENLGLGYGLLTAIQNTGCFLAPIAVGYLIDLTKKYLAAMIFLSILCLVGILCLTFLWTSSTLRQRLQEPSPAFVNRKKKLGKEEEDASSSSSITLSAADEDA